MIFPANLRQRLTLGMLGYSIFLSVAIGIHGYIVNERAEETVWESLLENELSHIEERQVQGAANYHWVDTDNLQLYGALNDTAIPAEFDTLEEGVHDEFVRAGREFVLLVRQYPAGKVVLALDISKMERDEMTMTWSVVIASVLLVMLLAVATYIGVGRLVRPLIELARSISALKPDSRGQRIEVNQRAPSEAIVIADALNRHLQHSDEFMERELAFVRMTRHELRTPVAVIASTAEVALDGKSEQSASDYFRRILQTTRDMEVLLALLLALAKDPERLRRSGEIVDVSRLIPSIVDDHRFLARSKRLQFELHCDMAVSVRAPEQIVRAAIGNLVRNAIENSDSGVIAIDTANGTTLTIRDPGRGMSEEELGRLYSELARSGGRGRGGIGLELIQRVCQHFGWGIRFSSEMDKGTVVVLDFERGC